MHTAAQKCNRHGVANDENYKKTTEDMLPVLKPSSHHVQNDTWIDNRKMLDNSMLAYSNHVKHLTEESVNHNQWLVVPRLNRSQADHVDNGRISTSSRESSTHSLSDPQSSRNKEASKQHNRLNDCISSGPLSDIGYTRPVLDSYDSDTNSFMDNSTISIVPFPPPVIELQAVPVILGESKGKDSPRKSNEGKNSRKPQFSNKNPLPPISKLKSRDSKSKINVDFTDENNTKTKKLLASQSLLKDTEGIDEVAKANAVNEVNNDGLQSINTSNDDTAKSDSDALKKKEEHKLSPKKHKKCAPKAVKGDAKQKADKKDLIQENKSAVPKIKSVLKKQGSVMQMEKSVKFGEELEFVRMVTKIEYPWYNESSSSENDEGQDEDENQTSSDHSSDSSSDEEKKTKKKKKRRRKKKPKSKSIKPLIVDELETITKLPAELDTNTSSQTDNINCGSIPSITTDLVSDSHDSVIDELSRDKYQNDDINN